MFGVKKFLSLMALMIGVLVVALLPTHFSVAQSYGPTDGNLFLRMFTFKMPSYPLYLYAIVEPNMYIIHFDGNGSTSGSMVSMNMIYDEEENLLANRFEKEGYEFKGWSSSEMGMVEYLDGEKVKNLVDTGEITLYAQREGGVEYTVEYYQENEDGTGYDLVETGAMYGIPGTEIILTGKEYTGFTLQTGDEVTISSGGVVPYYYTRNTYNLVVKDRDNVLIDTGVKYGVDIQLPADPEWTGNIFDGWDNVPEDGKMPAEDVEINSKWTYGEHTITFDTDGGTQIEPITGNYGDEIQKPENPIKEGYEFVGWEPELPDTMPYDDVEVKAIWKEVENERGWSGRGGRGTSEGGDGTTDGGDGTSEGGDGTSEGGDGTTDGGDGTTDGGDGTSEGGDGTSEGGDGTTDGGDGTTNEGDGEGEHGSPIDQGRTGIRKLDDKVDLETFFAYMWAHDMGIIDETWKDSDPDGYVTRGAMAQMVVKFTEKVLGKEIPERIPRECVWGDANREWKTVETKIYAEKACALGVMGIRMRNFMPNKILDRAEFGTILSRLLWGDKYDVVNATKRNMYYTRHLNALKENKIMTDIENPELKKELRKWAWLMLMRARVEERHQ